MKQEARGCQMQTLQRVVHYSDNLFSIHMISSYKISPILAFGALSHSSCQHWFSWGSSDINLLEYSPKENQLSSQGSYPSSPNGVSNHLYSHPLEGVDKTFLDTYDTIKKGNSTDDSGQYYYDKNELANGDLLLVRISPDEEGKFGFNLKGGVDQKMQLVVSRITPGSPLIFL
ncbi:unnamed protein product [Ranitomeya imitator]|uniref:PDZ domain-containing protein n=1 Tax=Ranitomeya imitator TaxID=111125 RepID=A0ABN9KXS0_9NEOB|nr:unnamed protein product [Ranitomeya imitator]